MSVRLGLDAKLYRNTADYVTPAWVEMGVHTPLANRIVIANSHVGMNSLAFVIFPLSRDGVGG